MSRNGWMLPVLILAMLLLSACQPVVAQDDAQPAAADCQVAGAWVGKFTGGPWDTPLIIQNTLTPLDPEGNKLVYVIRLVNPDATFKIPPFAESDYMSELVGEAVKTGPGTYDFSLLGYGVHERPEDRNEIIFLWTVDGSLTCEDGNRITNDVNLAIYSADQDANQDGIPDEGAVPMACVGPDEFGSAQRVPQMPRCEAPPK